MERDKNLLEQFAIQTLVVRERYYRDTYQWTKLRNSWHPDPSLTNVKISWYTGDIDGFVSGSQEMVKRGTNAVHTVSPIEIQINGDKALSKATGTIQVRMRIEGREYDCISNGRFVSRLQKLDQDWKLVSLEVIYDQDAIVPAAPFSGAVDMPIDGGGCRESYKYLGWVMSRQGWKINQDLAGSDRPETIRDLMEKNQSWLHSV